MSDLRETAASGGSRGQLVRTPGGLAKRIGRAVLWLLALVLLLHGVVSVMEPNRPLRRHRRSSGRRCRGQTTVNARYDRYTGHR